MGPAWLELHCQWEANGKVECMSKTVLYMWMSFDGFIAGPHDDAQHALGINGERLHRSLSEGDVDPESHRPQDPADLVIFDELMATGAVLTGRRTFELAGRWEGDHHDGVPVFVLTHQAPDEGSAANIHYVTDGIESAVRQAKAAANGRDILVHGAVTGQQLLAAGLLDEIQIGLVPVLLGQGRRLFDHMSADHIELALTRQLQGSEALNLTYLVRR